MRGGVRPGSFWGERVRQTIASQVEAIHHWKVFNRSYEDLPFEAQATWFIDPPYQKQGQHYHHGAADIEFEALANWCKTRPGQVIVCENEGADWLPFEPLGHVKTTRRGSRSAEVIWLKNDREPG
jgi:16S rRNA G966 N2-methylase RsmD